MAPLQFASFYSIACEMLLRDQEDSFRTSMQSFSDFKKLVVAHSVQDPPHRWAAGASYTSPARPRPLPAPHRTAHTAPSPRRRL